MEMPGNANRRSIMAPSSADVRAEVVLFPILLPQREQFGSRADGIIRLLGYALRK